MAPKSDATSSPVLSVSRLRQGENGYIVFSWTPGQAPARASLSVSLTPAERAVHALLVLGLGDLEIASLRDTTRSTVTKQIDAIFRKLGVRSRRELIALHSSHRA